MMPGARFFFLSHVQLFVLPNGRAGRADYNRLRRAAILFLLSTALFVFDPVIVLFAVRVSAWAMRGLLVCATQAAVKLLVSTEALWNEIR